MSFENWVLCLVLRKAWRMSRNVFQQLRNTVKLELIFMTMFSFIPNNA